jgi:GT2 family glycosyltransferase
MKVSVVIANKGGERFLKRCLDSIVVEKGDYEVIVVDDPNGVGAAAARNFGVANSTGKYILFLDVDTKIWPGWYKEILSFFRRNKKTGAAQVKIMRMGKNKFDSAGEFMGPFGFLVERARGAKDNGQFDEEELIFSGKSAGMIIRREVFEKLGGFDEDYQIFLEDTDLFWRVWLLGWQVRFCPKIVVEHAYLTKEKPMSFYLDNKVFYRGCRNTIMNLIKNLEVGRLWVVPVNVLCWLVLGLMFCLKGDLKRGKAMFAGVGWNIMHLPKTLKKRKLWDGKLPSEVMATRDLNYYFGKAKAYVTGRPF